MVKKSFLFLVVLFLSFHIFPATMSPRVRQVPKDLQEQIFLNPKDNIVALAKFLAGAGDASSKMKNLHDWICDNIAYDCDAFTEQGAGEQGYEAVLKKKRAVCVGYANLMAVMCEIVGVEAEIVYGWSKGFNYPGYLREQADHAWNAIKIGGKWRLIDVTWDAGFVERRSFIKRYTLQWYNLTPAQFIYSHLPEEEKWQLLPEKQIRSPEQFVKEPYIPGVFFEYGLSLGKDAPGYTNEISGVTGFDFVISKPSVSILAGVYGNPDFNTENFIWFENAGSKKRFLVDVPDRADYKVQLGARQNGTVNNPIYFSKTDFEQNVLPKMKNFLAAKKITQKEAELFEKSYYLIGENARYYFMEDLFDNQRNQANTKILKLLERNTSRYENVLTFELKAAADYEGYGKVNMRFPQMYQGFQSANSIRLNSPLEGRLKKGSEQHFSLSTPSYSKIALVLGKNEFKFFEKNQKTGAFELDFAVPGDLNSLDIFASKDGKHFESIISYELE